MRHAGVEQSARNRHARAPDAVAIVAGLVVGCFLTWNVSNVGAVADPLAEAYGTFQDRKSVV